MEGVAVSWNKLLVSRWTGRLMRCDEVRPSLVVASSWVVCSEKVCGRFRDPPATAPQNSILFPQQFEIATWLFQQFFVFSTQCMCLLCKCVQCMLFRMYVAIERLWHQFGCSWPWMGHGFRYCMCQKVPWGGRLEPGRRSTGASIFFKTLSTQAT